MLKIYRNEQAQSLKVLTVISDWNVPEEVQAILKLESQFLEIKQMSTE